MSIAVIDYGMGNLQSVMNALIYLSQDARIVKKPEELNNVEGIVLPGVGAFGEGISNLRSLGFIEPLETQVLQRKKPFLGICLGMQLLATKGLEYGEHSGLNWVPGTVDRIYPEKKLRVPHIGWNDVRFLKKDGLYRNLGDTQAFYFIHSYFFSPLDQNLTSGIFNYGLEYAASIEVDNISATQFHPEKSHKVGLAVLKNWCGRL